MSEFKLDPEYKEKWTAALRSGDFKQGNGVLYDEVTDSYCCLGVGEVVSGVSKEALDGIPLPNMLDGCKAPSIPLVERNILTRMNDGYSLTVDYKPVPTKSFNEIADWIDINL